MIKYNSDKDLNELNVYHLIENEATERILLDPEDDLELDKE